MKKAKDGAINDRFLMELAGFLKLVSETQNLGVEKPGWLQAMSGSVEDHAMDVSQRLRIGLFQNLDRDPYTLEEVADLVRTGEIPTVWIDPLADTAVS